MRKWLLIQNCSCEILSQHFRIFHILDSMPNNSRARSEVKQLQNILLKHFEGVFFKEGRIAAHLAQVKKFYFYFCAVHEFMKWLRCPAKLIPTTVAAIWFILPRSFFLTQLRQWLSLRWSCPFISRISTNFHCQTAFSSVQVGMAAWGLQNSDLTFVRREIRTLLFKYINRRDAVVEFHWRSLYFFYKHLWIWSSWQQGPPASNMPMFGLMPTYADTAMPFRYGNYITLST